MRVAIGIPNSFPDMPGPEVVRWAREAENLGFSSLSAIGRVAFPLRDELIVLATAAGATLRIGLLTGVLLGPTWNPVLLARQAAALHQLSGGRFTLGLGVGSRPDDFAATGAEYEGRGRRWDEALELMHRAWRGEPVAGSPLPVLPPSPEGETVPVLIGGNVRASVERTVRWGTGWIAGHDDPARTARMYDRVREAWTAAGRESKPDLRALNYFALGDEAERGRAYLAGYYGEEITAAMWPGVPKDQAALREVLARFEEIGTDEIVLNPTIGDVRQVELAAEAALAYAGRWR